MAAQRSNRFAHYNTSCPLRPVGNANTDCTTVGILLSTRPAENLAVSEETSGSLTAHVWRSRLQRYSHIRTRAKEDIIRTQEVGSPPLAVSRLTVGTKQ